jgi:hypothetical protein
MVWFGLWCLMPLSTIFQLYFVAVNFIGEENRRKPPTCQRGVSHLDLVCILICQLYGKVYSSSGNKTRR